MGQSYLKCKKTGNSYLDPENTVSWLFRAEKHWLKRGLSLCTAKNNCFQLFGARKYWVTAIQNAKILGHIYLELENIRLQLFGARKDWVTAI